MTDPSADRLLRQAARGVAVTLLILAAYVLIGSYDGLALTFFRLQDGVVIAGEALILLAWSFIGTALPRPFLLQPPRLWMVALAALALALACWAGTYLVMANYPLTRDEHMVVFDMGVFRAGGLATPLSPAWRPFAAALVPDFLLDLPRHAALVSGYLPGNAALRGAFALVLDPALFNPALAAVGLVALFAVARRLFPGDAETQALVLLLYATSAQLLVTAMTAYAMTAHLALNLVWLALFLRGTRGGHALALAVGLVATGLHQIVFHPLFVLPFLAWLYRRGEWRTALFYAGGYCLIGLFWSAYPHLVLATTELAPAAGPTMASGPYAFVTSRVVPLLVKRDPATLVLMALNLLRFAAWQNVALLPLALLAVPLARRTDGIARPLYWGIVLTVFAMAVLLPYQGHGWGYRYLHGLLGSFALLAGFGWQRVAGNRARALVGIATLATIAATVPFLLATTHGFVRPYARVNEAIGRVPAAMAIVDTDGSAFAIDEVRNPPDLTARPIRLASSKLGAAAVPILCSRGSLAFVSRPAMQALGLGAGHDPASPHFDALRAAAPPGCRVIAVTLR